MGYIEDNLADGERIVYRTKPHRVIFLLPVALSIVSLGAFIGGFQILGYLFLVMAPWAGFRIILSYLRSEFALTSRRVVGKFAADYFPCYPEVPLLEIRDVEFKPGMLARLFDYGTLVIVDRQGAKSKFYLAPGEFYRQIQTRAERNQRILK